MKNNFRRTNNIRGTCRHIRRVLLGLLICTVVGLSMTSDVNSTTVALIQNGSESGNTCEMIVAAGTRVEIRCRQKFIQFTREQYVLVNSDSCFYPNQPIVSLYSDVSPCDTKSCANSCGPNFNISRSSEDIISLTMNATTRDSGTYVCTNPILDNDTRARLFVLDTMPTCGKEVKESKMLRLSCSVSVTGNYIGDRAPIFKWTDDNNSLINGSVHSKITRYSEGVSLTSFIDIERPAGLNNLADARNWSTYYCKPISSLSNLTCDVSIIATLGDASGHDADLPFNCSVAVSWPEVAWPADDSTKASTASDAFSRWDLTTFQLGDAGVTGSPKAGEPGSAADNKPLTTLHISVIATVIGGVTLFVVIFMVVALFCRQRKPEADSVVRRNNMVDKSTEAHSGSVIMLARRRGPSLLFWRNSRQSGNVEESVYAEISSTRNSTLPKPRNIVQPVSSSIAPSLNAKPVCADSGTCTDAAVGAPTGPVYAQVKKKKSSAGNEYLQTGNKRKSNSLPDYAKVDKSRTKQKSSDAGVGCSVQTQSGFGAYSSIEEVEGEKKGVEAGKEEEEEAPRPPEEYYDIHPGAGISRIQEEDDDFGGYSSIKTTLDRKPVTDL